MSAAVVTFAVVNARGAFEAEGYPEGGTLLRCCECRGEMGLVASALGGDLYHAPGCSVLAMVQRAAAVKPVAMSIGGRLLAVVHRSEGRA